MNQMNAEAAQAAMTAYEAGILNEAETKNAVRQALGCMAAEAGPRPVPTDPRRDSRPDADSIFNPAFVDIPAELKDKIRAGRKVVSTADVQDAWRESDWRRMLLMALNGGTVIVPDEDVFMEVLPHLGTKRIAYHAEENFVCRNYSTLFASVVAAELWVNVIMVCDEAGHHMYSAVPVLGSHDEVRILVIEPQGDSVVPHTDAARHYTGLTGFALMV